MGTESQGTGLFYVDYVNSKCVADCKEGNGAICGGLANSAQDQLYSHPHDCCESNLHWKATEFCVVSLKMSYDENARCPNCALHVLTFAVDYGSG